MNVWGSPARRVPHIARRSFWIAVWAIAGLAALYAIGVLSTPAPTPIASRRAQPDPNADPAAAAAYIKKLARQSGGDFDKLSPDDRVFLNGTTGGHGRDVLASTARQQRQEAAAKKTGG